MPGYLGFPISPMIPSLPSLPSLSSLSSLVREEVSGVTSRTAVEEERKGFEHRCTNIREIVMRLN